MAQEGAGNPASPLLLLLQACLRSLRELSYRFARSTTGDGDSRTFHNTQRRVLRRLKEARIVPLSVNQIFCHDLQRLTEVTLAAINAELKQMKIAAIKKWREAMKQATTSLSIGKIVYQYLKRKRRIVPPNLVEDDVGNIIYDPQCAMDHIAGKWDSVFSVNASHLHDMQILKQVWPYIHDKGQKVALPPVTELQLWEQASRRRPDAAAGLDGWTTPEVQALPPSAFKPVASLFNDIEAGNAEFPTILTQVKMNCRFCDAPKESMQHFVDERTQLPEELVQPFSTTNFGPNFEMLGIAEVSLDNIRRKLIVSKTSDIQVNPWQEPLAGVAHVWTDGSVQLNRYPWRKEGMFSLRVGSVRLQAGVAFSSPIRSAVDTTGLCQHHSSLHFVLQEQKHCRCSATTR